MTKTTQIFIYILLATPLIGCFNSETPSNKKSDVFLTQYVKDSVVFGHQSQGKDKVVEIEFTKFVSFENLADRIEQIVCNDSVPAFIINTDSIYKTIYPINPCWDLYACILIYQRNAMTISNDSIIAYFDTTKPLDSLTNLLKAQIQNFGRSEYHAESFRKLIFTIEEDSLDAQRLKETLDYLTNVYFQVTNRTDIHLRIDKRIEPPNFLLDTLKKNNKN